MGTGFSLCGTAIADMSSVCSSLLGASFGHRKWHSPVECMGHKKLLSYWKGSTALNINLTMVMTSFSSSNKTCWTLQLGECPIARMFKWSQILIPFSGVIPYSTSNPIPSVGLTVQQHEQEYQNLSYRELYSLCLKLLIVKMALCY